MGDGCESSETPLPSSRLVTDTRSVSVIVTDVRLVRLRIVPSGGVAAHELRTL